MMLSSAIIIEDTLSGIITSPDREEGITYPLVLMFHGFASDKNEVMNFYNHVAALLAARDICSLRIDFRGFGSSKGKSEDASIDTMLEDAKLALRHSKLLSYVNPKKIGLIGFSLGAAISSLMTFYDGFYAAALLSPVMNFMRDFTAFFGEKTMEALQSSASPFYTIELPWRQVKIGSKFYDSLSTHSVGDAIKHFAGHLLLIAGSRDFAAANICQMHAISHSRHKVLKMIQDADHVLNLSDGNNLLEKIAEEIADFMYKSLMPSHKLLR